MLNFADYSWETSFAWHPVLESEDLPLNEDYASSARCLVGDTQLAIFRSTDNRLFASQNLCGHRIAFVLSEGTLGIDPKTNSTYVTCPLHRRKFFLDGDHRGSTKPSTAKGHSIATFMVKEDEGRIWVYLPEVAELDSVLGTRRWMPAKPDAARHKGPGSLAGAGRFSRPVRSPATCATACGSQESEPGKFEEAERPDCASQDYGACLSQNRSETENDELTSASPAKEDQQSLDAEAQACPVAKAQQALCW